jgi:hypothetical protein
VPRPSELVRRLLDAEAHHDLDGYRALLADEFTERTEGEITSQRGDDAAYAAARSWALAPSAYRRIDDISEAPGCVTVRYRLDHAVPVGITSRHRPSNFLGYSIYETRDGHIIRAGHFFSEEREPADALADAPSGTTAPTPRSEGRSGPTPRSEGRSGPTPRSEGRSGPTPRSEGRSGLDLSARKRRQRHRLLGGLTVMLSMLVAEPVWAAPVVATTAWRGGGLAFALLVPIYFALGYIASIVVIRRATKSATTGWFERWLSEGADRRYLRRIRRLVQAGTLIGFILSSMLFGALITTWLLLQLGRHRHIRRDAAASSLIFSVGFVGFYAGIASFIF